MLDTLASTRLMLASRSVAVGTISASMMSRSVMASPFGGRCGQMEGWSVGVVLAGGAAGRGAVVGAPVPLVLAGGLAPLDLDGVVADLDAMCAVACRVEVRGAVALAHGPEGAVGVFASAAHWAVSIFLMA